MKAIILLFPMLLVSCLNTTTVDNLFSEERFGIQLVIPKEMKTTSQLKQAVTKAKGNQAYKEALDDKTIDTWSTILQAQKGRDNNYLTIVSSVYDREVYVDKYNIMKSNRFKMNVMAFEKNKDVNVQENRSKTEIDQLEFDCQELVIFRGSRELGRLKTLERKYANDDLLILSITATDNNNYEFLNQVMYSTKFTRKN